MQAPLVFNIQRFSLHDGGGIRTILFFKGCPLHCPWCSNPEGIALGQEILRREKLCIRCSASSCYTCTSTPEDCPANALSRMGQYYTPQELCALACRDALVFEEGGGITLSGGEPLLHKEYLLELLSLLRRCVPNIAVETTGDIPPETLVALMPFIDLFLYDLKITDAQASRQITGGNAERIASNLRLLAQRAARVIPRIPLVPGYTDSEANLTDIALLAAENGLYEVHLLPFHQYGSGKYAGLGLEYTLAELEPPNEQAIQAAVGLLERHGLRVVVGGY